MSKTDKDLPRWVKQEQYLDWGGEVVHQHELCGRPLRWDKGVWYANECLIGSDEAIREARKQGGEVPTCWIWLPARAQGYRCDCFYCMGNESSSKAATQQLLRHLTRYADDNARHGLSFEERESIFDYAMEDLEAFFPTARKRWRRRVRNPYRR